MTIPLPVILAAFTRARRLHHGLTPGRLATLVGLRRDVILRVERGQTVSERATQKLIEWNELEEDHG